MPVYFTWKYEIHCKGIGSSLNSMPGSKFKRLFISTRKHCTILQLGLQKHFCPRQIGKIYINSLNNMTAWFHSCFKGIDIQKIPVCISWATMNFVCLILSLFSSGNKTVDIAGARLTKAYDVTIQRYRNSHAKIHDSKMHILRCMGSQFCVKFQRCPLKFHTKFWTHTPPNMHFMRW